MRLHVPLHWHRLCCAWRCDSYDSFFQPVSLGHSRLATVPAPWRRGALLLLLRSPPDFRFLPVSSALPNELFRFFRKMQTLALGAGATCLTVPRENRAKKGESNHVSKSRFAHRLRRQ